MNSGNLLDLSRFRWSLRPVEVHAWIELVVMGLYPFSRFENEYMLKHMRPSKISVNSLMKYLSKLSKVVEERITLQLPSKFSIVFDGWSAVDTHYISVFATFLENNERGYLTLLLGMAPMQNEDCLYGKEHNWYLRLVFEDVF